MSMWQKILVNVASAIIIGIVSGACIMVWNGATSVREQVDAHTKDLREIVTILQAELIDLKEQNNELAIAINDLRNQSPRKLKENVKTIRPRAVPDHDFLEQRIESNQPWEQRGR